jgi:hypothetical protein
MVRVIFHGTSWNCHEHMNFDSLHLPMLLCIRMKTVRSNINACMAVDA